jgi:hypothetical protein
VKVERKTADEYVAVESVPPDEVRVSRRHRWTSLADTDFVQWRRRVSVGQLRAEGFKVDDEDGALEDVQWESANRNRFNENLGERVEVDDIAVGFDVALPDELVAHLAAEVRLEDAGLVDQVDYVLSVDAL